MRTIGFQSTFCTSCPPFDYGAYPLKVLASIQRRGYGHSSRALGSTRYSALTITNANFTCKDIADLIYEKRLNYYRSDENGNGCLYWLIKLIDEMKRKGREWLHPDAFRELRDYGEKQKVEDKFIVANGKGEFFG